MKKQLWMIAGIWLVSAAASAQPGAFVRLDALPDWDTQTERGRRDDRHASDDRLYQTGLRALDSREWDRAVETFTRVAGAGGARADAALYWKAWAHNKAGQRADALATLNDLRARFAQSPWLNEAKALEVEIRQASGQSIKPGAEPDDELKLMALNGLAQMDSAQAIPMLETFLQGPQSPKLKERALFVLAQIGTPRAREVLVSTARGQGNPDLQSKAVQYLGIHGGTENRAVLAELYTSSIDIAIKRRILQAFMVAGERKRLFSLAQTEKDESLRREAVQQLGVMGAHDELAQLYAGDGSLPVKKAILQAMFVGGDADRLMQLARSEANPELRRTAIRNLGLMGNDRAAGTLLALYAEEKDPQNRKAVVQALFIQGNAAALVQLARKESDPAMKRSIVQHLSLMHAKEATDYLLEMLK